MHGATERSEGPGRLWIAPAQLPALLSCPPPSVPPVASTHKIIASVSSHLIHASTAGVPRSPAA